jgi:hypothetical protein
METELRGERANYAEPIRYDRERNVYGSEGVRLVSFSSPNRLRHLLVNAAIRFGIKNPLREDLSGMEVTEEQVREAMIREGMIEEGDERKVLIRG